MRKSFVTDYIYTFATQVITLAAGVLLLKLLSGALSEDGLGVYIVIKRIILLATPLVTLNLGVTIPRYINLRPEHTAKYYWLTFLSTMVLGALLLGVFVLWREFFAEILFGDGSFQDQIFPTMLFLVATGFHFVNVGYYRGQQNYQRMNIIIIMYWIGAFVAYGNFLAAEVITTAILRDYFITYSVFVVVINLIFMLFEMNLLKRASLASVNFSSPDSREFFGYGIQRIPAGFFAAALAFVPVFFATNYFSLKAAAQVGIVIAVYNLFQQLVYPLNVLFLPKFSALKYKNDEVSIRRYSQNILELILSLVLIVGIFLQFFSSEIIVLWFGEKYRVVGEYLALIAPFVGIFLANTFIRGILDALYFFPYINVVTIGGVVGITAVSILTVFSGWDVSGLVIAYCTGTTLTGLISLWVFVKRQQLTFLSKSIMISLAWTVILYFIMTYVNLLLGAEITVNLLLAKLGIALGAFLISMLIYLRLGMGWMQDLLAAIKAKNGLAA
jgi:O-antigen/teichoic acid export membrane protein